MSLAGTYAAVLKQGFDAGCVVAYMKHRGHASLIPQVARMLEREAGDTRAPLLLLAKKNDEHMYAKEISSALAELGSARAERVEIDPRAVGGFSVRANARLIDRTFRTALVAAYRRAVSPRVSDS